MYVADTVLIAPSPNALQQLIVSCQYFANVKEITFNSNKCSHVHLPQNGSDLRVPVFNENGNTSDIVKYYKYLGFNLSVDLKDDIDIAGQIRGVYTRGNMIKCFKHCSYSVQDSIV